VAVESSLLRKSAEIAKATAPANHNMPLILEFSAPPVNVSIDKANQMPETIQQSPLEYRAKPTLFESMRTSLNYSKFFRHKKTTAGSASQGPSNEIAPYLPCFLLLAMPTLLLI